MLRTFFASPKSKFLRIILTANFFVVALLLQFGDAITIHFNTTICEQPMMSYLAIPFWILGACFLLFCIDWQKKGKKQ